MFPNMGFSDWAIVLVLVLLLFGARRLPDLARALGRSIGIFKRALQEGGDEPGGRAGRGKRVRARGKRTKR